MLLRAHFFVRYLNSTLASYSLYEYVWTKRAGNSALQSQFDVRCSRKWSFDQRENHRNDCLLPARSRHYLSIEPLTNFLHIRRLPLFSLCKAVVAIPLNPVSMADIFGNPATLSPRLTEDQIVCIVSKLSLFHHLDSLLAQPLQVNVQGVRNRCREAPLEHPIPQVCGGQDDGYKSDSGLDG